MAAIIRGRGRAKKEVDQEKVVYLRSLHFKWKEISNILGVSEKTLRRRAIDWNIPSFLMVTLIHL